MHKCTQVRKLRGIRAGHRRLGVNVATLCFALFAATYLPAQTIPQPPQGEGSELDGPTEFVMSLGETEISLNPISSYTASEAQVYTALFEGLVTYHPLTLEPIPGVARTWTVSNDGRRWTFQLREDARYDNGDPVIAQHFRDTWLALLDPEAESAYSFLFDVIEGAEEYRRGRNTDPDSVGIRPISGTELVVELNSPATHFLDILCHHSFVALHPEMVSYGDDVMPDQVVSNGPYTLVSADENELVMEQNEQYWDASEVSIPNLRIRTVDDPETITEAFNRGSVQWLAGGWNLDAVETRSHIVVNPLFATSYFFFRADEEPWQDDNVRRAMALLLPWVEIRSDEIYFTPAQALVPTIPFYENPDGIVEQNRDEALRLLSEAGYPRGEGLPDVTVTIPGGEDNIRITDLFASAWEEELGIEVVVTTVPYPRYFDALEGDNYTLGTISWIGDFADPLTFLQMWTSGSNLNDSGYSNAEFDELITQSLSQRGTTRFATLAAAEALLLDTAVVLPIAHSPAVNVIDTQRISGWHPNPLNVHPFKHLAFAALAPIPRVADRPLRLLRRSGL